MIKIKEEFWNEKEEKEFKKRLLSGMYIEHDSENIQRTHYRQDREREKRDNIAAFFIVLLILFGLISCFL